MKKNIIYWVIVLIFIVIIFITAISIKLHSGKEILKENNDFEIFLEKEIYGTDVVTLINKAISENTKNNISTDEKGLYIANNENSILIDIVMITNEEKKETTSYKMEAINKVGTKDFIKNFNTAKFKCNNVQYHKKTGKISYMQLTQQYEE